MTRDFSLLFLAALTASAQPALPKFEVASIRPTKTCDVGGGGGASGQQLKNGPPRGSNTPSPDRLSLCGTAEMFLRMAFILPSAKPTRANPSALLAPDIPIEGGPAWVRTETFIITAKTERPTPRGAMTEPMLQALLIDRFQLKVHRDTRDLPAYALTVGKGGPKLRKSTCMPPAIGPDAPSAPPTSPLTSRPCPLDGATRKGDILAVDRLAKTPRELSLMLGLDRPVVDRTGLSDVFDYHFEFIPDESTPLFQMRIQQLPDTASPGTGTPLGTASIFTAFLEQLGLRLEPVRAPREFLIIDSIKKPSEN